MTTGSARITGMSPNLIASGDPGPAWYEMLRKAMEIVASIQGGSSLSTETKQRVYQEILDIPDAEEQLRRAIQLADAAILVAYAGIAQWLLALDEIDLEEDPEAGGTLDVAWALSVIEAAIEEMHPPS